MQTPNEQTNVRNERKRKGTTNKETKNQNLCCGGSDNSSGKGRKEGRKEEKKCSAQLMDVGADAILTAVVVPEPARR